MSVVYVWVTNYRDKHRGCHVNHYKYRPLEGSPSGAKAQRKAGQ